jgi:dTDP-4-dehydrorhamnose reductase
MGVDAEIRPVSSSEFSRPANRPNNAILSKERFEEWTGERIPVWEEGMLAYLKEEGLIT